MYAVFKDQFISSFKNDSFMGFAKDSVDDKSICAEEGQDSDENITSKDFEFIQNFMINKLQSFGLHP